MSWQDVNDSWHQKDIWILQGFFIYIYFNSANNFAMKAKRKTLNAGDVLAAMEEMEFERFLEPLREALEG